MKKVLLSLGVVAILAACGGAESAMSDLANAAAQAAAQADSLAKIAADSLQAAQAAQAQADSLAKAAAEADTNQAAVQTEEPAN